MSGSYSRLPRPVAERFLEKILKTESCWLWTASKSITGYGMFAIRHNKIVHAHRYSWEHHRGPIPDGMQVLHDCPGGDNPLCVNPEHLWLGDHLANMADKVKKGRGFHYTPNGIAGKLNDEIVRRIRRMGWISHQTVFALAKEYGVGPKIIWDISKGTGWKHVSPLSDQADSHLSAQVDVRQFKQGELWEV